MNASAIIHNALNEQELNQWNKNNKLSEEPLLLVHGTYSNSHFEFIERDTGSNKNHFANGLHLSNNIEEINGHYANNLNNPLHEIQHLDISQKIYGFIENLIEQEWCEDTVEILQKQFYFSQEVKHILDNLDIDKCKSLFDFIKICQNELSDQLFFENFKIKKNDLTNDFIKNTSENQTAAFHFLRNIYCQNEGLVIPFYLRSSKPLYCLDPKIAYVNGWDCSYFFIFDHYQDLDEIREQTNEAIQNIQKSLISKEYSEELVSLIINQFKESIDGSIEYGMDYYYDVFENIINEHIQDNQEAVDDFIESFHDDFFETDYYCYFSDNEEFENTNSAHKEYCLFIKKIQELLNDYDYNMTMDILSGFENQNVAVRDLIYNIEKENPELKETITNKIIPEIYDVAVFYANFEFEYVNKNYNQDTFHYVVFKSECLKYAYNKTFSSNLSNMAARRVEENTDFHISKEEIDLGIRKIRDIYPYFPKVIVRNHKSNTAAEFDRVNEVIHLYQKNIKSGSELLKTLLHEYIIHYGLHKTLGSEGEQLLLKTYEYFNSHNLLDNIRKSYPEIDESTIQGKCLLAEEQLAHMCENQLFKRNSFIDKTIYQIKKIFFKIKQKLGISHMDDNIFLTIDTIDKSLKIQNDFDKRHEDGKSKHTLSMKKRLGF